MADVIDVYGLNIHATEEDMVEWTRSEILAPPDQKHLLVTFMGAALKWKPAPVDLARDEVCRRLLDILARRPWDQGPANILADRCEEIGENDAAALWRGFDSERWKKFLRMPYSHRVKRSTGEWKARFYVPRRWVRRMLRDWRRELRRMFGLFDENTFVERADTPGELGPATVPGLLGD